MTEQTTATAKPTLREKAAVAWKKHERKILIATTVTSTGVAVLMRAGISQHNAFLKEHGLYEQFYNIEAATENL